MASNSYASIKKQMHYHRCSECGLIRMEKLMHQRYFRESCPTDRGNEVREGYEWVCDDCEDSNG